MMKKIVNQIYKNQFWFLTGIETLSAGILTIAIDWKFDENIPYLLKAFDPPYVPWLMLTIGLYSLISAIRKLTILTIVGNAVIWAFIATTSILEAIIVWGSPLILMPALLSTISVVIVLRVLFNASKTKMSGKG